MLRRTTVRLATHVVAGHPARCRWSGSVSVVIIRTVVVLPRAVGAEQARAPCPRGTAKLTPSTAVCRAVPPNLLTSSMASMAGCHAMEPYRRLPTYAIYCRERAKVRAGDACVQARSVAAVTR